MRRSKRISIKTETLEQWVVSVRSQLDEGVYCQICQGTPTWLSIAEACRASELSPAEICGLVEHGRIHSSQTIEGHLLICGTSLGAGITPVVIQIS